MRIFLVAWIFRLSEAAVGEYRKPISYHGQYFVEAASVPPTRFSRQSLSPDYYHGRRIRSRVFRNAQIINGTADDEPKRSSGRFQKRVEAVRTHDIPQQSPSKETFLNPSFSYDEEKHHVNKLSEDNSILIEASEFARQMERTTVAVRTEPFEQTTQSPQTTTQAISHQSTHKHEFHQPPPAFVQPSTVRNVSSARVFQSSVQGTTQKINTQKTSGPIVQLGPNYVPNQQYQKHQKQQTGLPNLLPNPHDSTAAVLPNIGLPLQIPNFAGQLPTMAGLPPPQLPTQLQGSHVPNQQGGSQAGQTSSGVPPPPQLMENRFEVINAQSANSSLEQLGCGYDWLTNSCKDVFNIGWCGQCHDFGNIFLHDCKCIKPLVQLPPRPQPQQQNNQQRPPNFRVI